jgi:DNA-binding IclR family transcriptional regulator
MPRKPALPSLADHDAAPGGSAAVDKALSLLRLFVTSDSTLSLSDCAAQTKLYKSTARRLLASLEHGQLVAHHPDGRFGLGPSTHAASHSKLR